MTAHQRNRQTGSSRRPLWAGLLIGLVGLGGVGILLAKVVLVDPLEDARSRAHDIACSNNLMQIELAAKIHAIDHNDCLPWKLSELQEEMGLPRLLACPKDQRNTIHKATDWTQVNFAASSYELLHPGGIYDDESTMTIVKCRFHGSLGD